MAKSFSHCTIEAKKVFDEFTPEELEEFTQLLEAKRGGVAPDAFKRLVESMATEQISLAQTFKHTQLMNVRARIDIAKKVSTMFPKDKVKGFRSLMLSSFKNELGVAKAQRAKLIGYLTALEYDLEVLGLRKEFESGMHDLGIFIHLDAVGKVVDPPVKSSPTVKSLADIVKKWNDRLIDDANRMGAGIKYDPTYIMRQSHDSFALRKASEITGGPVSNDPEVNYPVWRDDMLRYLDHEKTFSDAADPEKFMRTSYDALVSGTHLTHAGEDIPQSVMQRIRSAASQLNKERVFHFKDGESFYEYNQRYGTRNLKDSLISAMENTAHSTGLMKVFGPNARDNFHQVFDGFLRTVPVKERERMGKSLKKLDRVFDRVDGTDRAEANAIITHMELILLTAQNLSKLGSAVFAALGDIHLKATNAWRNGIPWMKAYGDQLNSLFDGMSKLDRLEAISKLGVATDAMIAKTFSRYGDSAEVLSPSKHADPLTRFAGSLSKLNNLFFDWNYVRPFTEKGRVSHTLMLSHHLGLNASVNYADLNVNLSHELGKFGIGEKEWGVIRKALWDDAKGRTLMVPERIRETPDVDIDPLIKEDIANIRAAAAEELGVIATKQGRINTRLEKRVAKFRKSKAARLKSLAKHKAQLDATASKGEAGARLQIAKLETQTEIATLDAEMATHITAEKSETQIRAFIDAVEEGAANVEGAPRRQTGPKASRAVFKLSDTVQKQADALGRRKGKAQAKIQEINRKIKSQKTDTAKRQDVRSKKTFEAIDRELDELAQLSVDLEADFKQTRIHADVVVRRIDERIELAREIERERIEWDFRQYFMSETDDAVINPDAYIQNMLTLGTKAGTPAHLAVRTVMQFKHVPVAISRQVIGKLLFGQAPGTSALRTFEGIAHTVVMSAVFGYISISLKDLTKAKSIRYPESPEEATKLLLASMVQGGSAGIYGDFLFGEMKNRYGQSALGTMMGPTFGSASDIADMFSSLWSSEGRETLPSKAVRFAKNNTPFVNLFYTRAAMDFLIWHNLQEMANPGYLSRAESLVDKNNAQSYIISPSAVIPSGGTLNPLEITGNIVEEAGDTELADFVGRN